MHFLVQNSSEPKIELGENKRQAAARWDWTTF
jgi:hypothetical protein